VEFKRAVQYRQSLVQALVRLKCWIKAKCREYGVVTKGMSVYHPKNREEVIGLLPSVAQQRLRHAYARLDQIEQQEKEAVSWMLDYSRSFKPIGLFTTVPGVGKIGACTFFAYVQTPHRFPDKHDLWSYAGLKVITPTSAGKPVGPPRLTTGGVRALKHMTRQAFLGALHANCGKNALADYYRRQFQASQNPTGARLITQRKILSILLHIWKKEEAFDPNKV
jgi:transposase